MGLWLFKSSLTHRAGSQKYVGDRSVDIVFFFTKFWNQNQHFLAFPPCQTCLHSFESISLWPLHFSDYSRPFCLILDDRKELSRLPKLQITYCSKDEMEQRKRLYCLLIFGPIVQKQTDFSKVRSHNLGICERSTPLDSSLQHIMIMSVVGLISFSRISWAALFKSSWTISVAFQWNRSVLHHDFVLEAPQ